MNDRPVLRAADGPGLRRDAPVRERDPETLSRDQRTDRPPVGLARRGRAGRPAQQEAGGLGELLLLGPGPQGVSGGGPARLSPAPSVVGSKYQTLSLGYSRSSDESLHERLGLVRLKGGKRDLSCAKA